MKDLSYLGLADVRGRVMVSGNSGEKHDDLAHRLFDVVTWCCLAVPRGRRKTGDLKEIEFLTLSLLHQHAVLIVGDIQRQLGVLPAQMSRIIRALENRERPLICCKINAQDKRKIDVALTPSGQSAFQEYHMARVRSISGLLSKLQESDFNDLDRVVNQMRDIFQTHDVK